MDWYYYIALVAIVSQLVFLMQMWRNNRYALSKYKKKRDWYRPRTALLVPCKGVDSAFETNIRSFFNQDYENYVLWFVVAEESDPAYGELCRLKKAFGGSSKPQDVQIFLSGQVAPDTCSQKIHNLLCCYEKIGDDIEVLAFADSDVCIGPDWLSHIVYPLRKPENGASSGYRWFVPKKSNVPTLALSAVNAKIAQLLGNTVFNQAWGGSMAIRVDVFRSIGLDKIWPRSLSDDLSLSSAVKKAGMKVAFVPACLVASYESTTWRRLFEFGRRQFLITRIYAPGTWWFGLISSIYSILGLWAGAILAVYAVITADKHLQLYAAVPVLFFASQFIGAVLRQRTMGRVLHKDRFKIKIAGTADILLFWVWSWLLLVFIVSSVFGRTICWRGIRYKLLGPTETIVISR